MRSQHNVATALSCLLLLSVQPAEALGNLTGINVQNYSATGAGCPTDDSSALIAADSAAGAGVQLYFPPGSYCITSNVTFSSDVQFASGAYITMPHGVVVAFNGRIMAGRSKIVDLTNNPVNPVLGTGFIAVQGHPIVTTIYPEWFGLAGDGITDDGTPLNMASLVAVSANTSGTTTTSNFGATIDLPARPMLVKEPWTILPGTNISGDYTTTIAHRGGSGTYDPGDQAGGTGSEILGDTALLNACLSGGYDGVTVYIAGGNVNVRNLGIAGPIVAGAPQGTALQIGKSGRTASNCFETGNINGPSGVTLENLTIVTGNPGVEFNGVTDTYLRHVRFEANINDFTTYTAAFNQLWFDHDVFNNSGGPSLAGNGAGIEAHFVAPQVIMNSAVNLFKVDANAATQEFYFTQPHVTTYGVSGSNAFISFAPQAASASVTAYITGTTMTVSAVSSGALWVGQTLSGAGITSGTYITAYAGVVGGMDTYTLNNSMSIASETITAANAPHVLDIEGGSTDAAIVLSRGADGSGSKQGGVSIQGMTLNKTDISVVLSSYHRIINNFFNASSIFDNNFGLTNEQIVGNRFDNSAQTSIVTGDVSNSVIMSNQATGGQPPITNGVTKTGACIIGNVTDSGSTGWNPISTAC